MDALERLGSASYFKDETFEAPDLTGFDFAGKDFFRCTFRNAKLGESRWSEASLEDCLFEDCDLTRMLPGDVRATGVRFLRCKLMGVAFEKLSPTCRFDFEECSLRYASFTSAHLRKTSFVRCRAQETSFVDSDLQEADFSGADLAGATFQDADLRGADLSTASNAFVDPAKNRVRGLRVSVETAAALATSFGLRVAGYESEEPKAPARRR